MLTNPVLPDDAAPLVTIGIPTLCRLQYLQEAVRSALNQEYSKIQVLISKDYQTDSIEGEKISRWAERLSREETRITYVEQRSSRGLAGNWNALADAARGSFLIVIGDDDRLTADGVTKLVEHALHFDADVVFGNHWLIDAHGQRLGEETKAHNAAFGRAILQPGLQKIPQLCVWSYSVPMTSALIKTTRARDLRFKEDMNTPETEFFARLANCGGRFVFVPDLVAEYRVHPASETVRGLTIERLFWHLHPIPVPPPAARAKRLLMKGLVGPAMRREIDKGNYDGARSIAYTRYLSVKDVIRRPRLIFALAWARLPRSMAHTVVLIVRLLIGRKDP